MSKPSSILLFTDWYWPAQKAGGPVQSTQNMVKLLEKHYHISIVCRATDWGDQTIMPNIMPDQWQVHSDAIKILYLSPQKTKLKNIKQIIKEENPNILYINGIFSFYFSILPLFFSKVFNLQKTYVAVRGMLHTSALSVKPLKKQLFLSFARGFGLFQGNQTAIQSFSQRYQSSIQLLASNAIEKKAIQSALGSKINTKVLGNVPIHPEHCPQHSIPKTVGSLKLIFVGRIAPEKNPLTLLKALQKLDQPIAITWVGSAIDQAYYNNFLAEIKALPKQVQSKHIPTLEHDQLLACIAEHHVMVLPSLGENFGHAIYEALACSRPVIIGNNTAWQRSEFIRSCEPENVEALTQLIQEAASLDQAAFDHLSIASKQFAQSWYTDQNFDKAYLDAFS